MVLYDQSEVGLWHYMIQVRLDYGIAKLES